MTKKISFFSKLKNSLTGQKNSAKGSSDTTIELLEEQLKQNPGNFRLRLKLADSYITSGEKEKALNEYCKNARLYLEHDFKPLAIATYKKILNEDPLHLEANLELGRIYRQKKFFADATSCFYKVFVNYYEDSQSDKALQTLETIIGIAPDKKPYRKLLKKLFPNHQEDAKSIYSDVIITSPKKSVTAPPPATENDDTNFFDLGTELGEDIERIEDLPVTTDDSNDIEAESNEQGVEDIFQVLKSTISEGGDDSDKEKFHYNLAQAYNELKMPEQALLESEEALKSSSFRLPTLLLRSHIYMTQGAATTALAQIQLGLLEKGLTRQEYVTFKLQLGLILKEMAHYHQALEAFREAHALDPKNVELTREIESLENHTEQN